ncbi:MAG: hypothetical protein FMNOHCHN_02649 [Ignavibacteriaceae bacterium]|nr:hypothetical protein [Ignavibacteriaceae bacterium]MCK6615372.1 AmmeMemoRadiSam system protein A [Ignavibacteriaceae bacterium]
MLSKSEQGVLLFGAREALRTLFDHEYPYPSVQYKNYPALMNHNGAFVTLYLDNHLRGCIGYVESDAPIFETVCEAAILAATEDPRFAPLTAEELPQVLIEVSVLSVPKKIKDYVEIEIGKHGLIVDEAGHRGLLLPQVAVEHKMKLDQFLTALCQKAGLPGNYWTRRMMHMMTFEADVFGEVKHRNLTGERR